MQLSNKFQFNKYSHFRIIRVIRVIEVILLALLFVLFISKGSYAGVNTVAGTAVLGGTVFPKITQTDIIGGHKTITITLSNCTWAEDILTDFKKRNALITGFTVSSDLLSWDIVKASLKANPVSMAVDSTNTMLTITLPAVTNYDIISDQIVNLTIPKSVLAPSVSDISVARQIVIELPMYTNWKSLDNLIGNGTLPAYLKNNPLDKIHLRVPKKYINTITINPIALAEITIPYQD